MSLPILIAFAAIYAFGIAAIIFSLREEKLKKHLEALESIRKQENFERIVLREIHSHIDSSITAADVIEHIVAHIPALLPATTIASVTLLEGKAVFKAQIREAINPHYLESIKHTMMQMIGTTHSTSTEDHLFGVPLDETLDQLPASLIQVPITLNNSVVGVITVSSKHPNAYTLQQKLLLTNIGKYASQLVTSVTNILTINNSSMKIKDDFTNIIVHELRSPLNAIKTSTQLLRSDDKLTDAEQERLIKLIQSQSNKLLDEVSLILDAAKLESGLFTIHKLPGDMTQLIKEQVEDFFPLAQAKHIDLSVHIEKSLPLFCFDTQHMSQVITNLLSNSMKFTSTGGKITIHAKQEKDHAIISISDTGSGIPKDKQHLLFSKFSQIATPNAQIGTGLGLYIVKGVVIAHGGEISLDSTPGKGTTISFTLPLAS